MSSPGVQSFQTPLKRLARSLLPRRVRNWLRSPRASLRFVWEEISYRLGNVRTVELRPGWTIRCHPLAWRCAYSPFVTDPEQAEELDCFVHHCQPGMVLFDVGAHFGVFSLAALHYGGKAARVVAADPSALAAHMLRIMMALNGASDRCTVEQKAVSDHVGQGRVVEVGVIAAGYAVPPEPSHSLAETTAVPTLTLDALAERHGLIPTHLKIDVEGYERAVLQGGRQLLDRHGSMVFLELHNTLMRKRGEEPRATLQMLQNLGYRFFNSRQHPITPDDLLAVPLVRFVAQRTS